jgi:long-chain acyl-CoA synthetase
MNNVQLKDLKELVLERFKEHGEKTAIIEKNKNTDLFEDISYIKLRNDILALGTAMYEKLNLKNEKIAVIGENSSKWFITYMATVCGLGVIVPLDKELPSNEILNLLQRSKAKCVVYSSKKIKEIEEVKKQLPDSVIFVEMEKEVSDDNAFAFDDLIKLGNELINSKHEEYINKKIDASEFAILLFTSGTTGKSKGVMLSNNNLTSNVYAAINVFGDKAKLKFLSVLPMHHTYELTATYLCVLTAGGTIGIFEGLKYIGSNLKEIKPDCLVCVPVLVENVKKKIEKSIREMKKEKLISTMIKITDIFNNKDLKRKIFKKIHESFGGNLKYLIVGAAPMDKKSIDFMEGLGFIIMQGYGLTETSPLVAVTLLDDRVSGTVGKVICNIDVKIDSKNNEKEGEIIVKGPNVMLGYYENEEETNKVLKDGYFYTGDIGYFDSNNNLVISGRIKNLIVTSNGKNIYPEEIENYINKIPLVKESLVYEYNENDEDPVVATKVTLDEDYIQEKYGSNRPTDQEIYDIIWDDIKKINRTMVSYKAVKKLTVKKEDFKKTTTMKIKRFEEK